MSHHASHVGPMKSARNSLESLVFSEVTTDWYVVLFGQDASAKHIVTRNPDATVVVDQAIFHWVFGMTTLENVASHWIFNVLALDFINQGVINDRHRFSNCRYLVIWSAGECVCDDVLLACTIDDVEVELLQEFTPSDLSR